MNKHLRNDFEDYFRKCHPSAYVRAMSGIQPDQELMEAAYNAWCAGIGQHGGQHAVRWVLSPGQVQTLADELKAAAEAMSGGEPETDLRLIVARPGQFRDLDAKTTNERPILVICLDDYPEEGGLPIDPETMGGT